MPRTLSPDDAERALRRQGLPLSVPARRRTRHLFPGAVPVFAFLAVAVLLLEVLGAVPEDAQTTGDLQSLPADVYSAALILGGVLAAVLLLGVGLVCGGLAAWMRNRLPEGGRQVFGALLWLLLLGLLGFPMPARWPVSEALGLPAWAALAIALAVLLAEWLGADAVLGWSLVQAVRELRRLPPMVAKVLPILMVAVLFSFVNAELWKVADSLDVGKTLGVAGIMGVLVVFVLATSIPKTVRAHLGSRVRLAAQPVPEQERGALPWTAAESPAPPVGRLEWANVLLVPLMVQLIQTALFSGVVFLFFLWFGDFAITDEAAASWINHDPSTLALGGLSLPFTTVLIKVSLVIGGFAGLSFAATSATTDEYHEDFLLPALERLRSAVGLRNAYRRQTDSAEA